jgi:putative DNA primase/helicase
MRFTIYTADCTGNERNAIYPNKAVITSSRELGTAAAFDHVCAAYKDNYRSRDNFLASDVAVMDCDNDHTENPKEWVTGEKLLAMLPNVAVAIVPSRNSGKAKEGRKARPRFHAYFPITEVQDEKAYTALKQGIREEFPFFDAQALDAARFLYGTEVVPEESYGRKGSAPSRNSWPDWNLRNPARRNLPSIPGIPSRKAAATMPCPTLPAGC